MYEYFGNRDICIARELTKIHEEYRYTNFKDAIINIEENGIKGEIVLVISGASEDKINEEKNKEIEQINSLELVKEYMKNGDTKRCYKKVAKLKGVNKDVVYKECLIYKEVKDMNEKEITRLDNMLKIEHELNKKRI